MWWKHTHRCVKLDSKSNFFFFFSSFQRTNVQDLQCHLLFQRHALLNFQWIIRFMHKTKCSTFEWTERRGYSTENLSDRKKRKTFNNNFFVEWRSVSVCVYVCVQCARGCCSINSFDNITVYRTFMKRRYRSRAYKGKKRSSHFNVPYWCLCHISLTLFGRKFIYLFIFSLICVQEIRYESGHPFCCCCSNPILFVHIRHTRNVVNSIQKLSHSCAVTILTIPIFPYLFVSEKSKIWKYLQREKNGNAFLSYFLR